MSLGASLYERRIMIIRILCRSNRKRECGWYWQLEASNGVSICRSENYQDMDGLYTTGSTAIKSARRFIKKYFNKDMPIEIKVGFTGKPIKA